MVGVREREGEESKGGRVTDQHNRHRQPTQLFPVLRLYPSPGPGPDHSYSPPPSHFSLFLIVSAHTAPSVIPHSIWSAPPFASPPVTAPTPGAVLLCHLVGSSSVCQPNPPPNTVTHNTGSYAMPKPGVLSHSRCCKAHRYALVVHYRVLDLLFLLYR